MSPNQGWSCQSAELLSAVLRQIGRVPYATEQSPVIALVAIQAPRA